MEVYFHKWFLKTAAGREKKLFFRILRMYGLLILRWVVERVTPFLGVIPGTWCTYCIRRMKDPRQIVGLVFFNQLHFAHRFCAKEWGAAPTGCMSCLRPSPHVKRGPSVRLVNAEGFGGPPSHRRRHRVHALWLLPIVGILVAVTYGEMSAPLVLHNNLSHVTGSDWLKSWLTAQCDKAAVNLSAKAECYRGVGNVSRFGRLP